ncbi:MAG: DUF6049 family protein [Acidimicrobiales bacterium]
MTARGSGRLVRIAGAALVAASCAVLGPVGVMAATGAPPARVPADGPVPAGPSGLPAAGLAGASFAPGVTTGADGLTLLAQSPWVGSGQEFHMRLGVSATDPSGERLVVSVYRRLMTRSGFDNAAAGRLAGSPAYTTAPLALLALQPDVAGGVDVNIPVNETSTESGVPQLSAEGGSGVFPLQVTLYNRAGVPQGRRLTTFLVFAAGPPSATELPRLSVAVVVPVFAAPSIGPHGQVGGLTSAESTQLSSLASALSSRPEVHLSLAVTPQTVEALATGSATDKATLAALASLVSSGGDQVLPATYARVSMDALESAGLGKELTEQIRTGSSVLAKAFGSPASPGTWVVDAPVSAATLRELVGSGASRLVVPERVLSALPAAATETTFAFPTLLTDPGGPPLTVYGADSVLTADFDMSGGPVLAATQLLAELSMIQLETPGITRGVAVLPPAQWRVDPAFVSTLVDGLSGHPLLSPVTASGLFGAVQTATLRRSLLPEARPSAPAGLFGTAVSVPVPDQFPNDQGLAGDAADVMAARRQLSGLSSLLAPDDAKVVALQRDLLTAESAGLSDPQRRAVLANISGSAKAVLGQVVLPGSSSITLTSNKGQIPLTILSGRSLRAKVQLRLTSQRLIFRPFAPPGGRCSVPTPTSEVCVLTLVNQNTTLKVPVETRSSGVFPLDVSLTTPDASIVLARDRDTVRSTAVSGVGIVLIVLAAASLAIWWVRDLRHGRRARRLVPAPDFDEEGERAGDGGVDDFFATPPPDYERSPGGRAIGRRHDDLSPSGGDAGRNVNTRGPARTDP